MFRFLLICLLTFSFEIKANQIVDTLELEIKTADDLPGEAVCRSVAPLFTSNGPWGFKLTSSVKCNVGGTELVVDPNKGPLSWELHVKFEDAELLFSICRNVRVTAGQVEQN